jgi:hypothetical protein
MAKFMRDPLRLATAPDDLLPQLIYGWGNKDWAAGDDYLQACIQEALRSSGPILECGSGLTTILLAGIAQATGNIVWSLEHDIQWGDKVGEAIAGYGITSSRLCVQRLRNYGEFSWYDPPLHAMPDHFSLVVCDGPPGDTKGGRYGLLQVMRQKLEPGATILLDDAERDDESEIANRWATELGTSCRLRGGKKPYIEIRIPKKF